MKSPNLIAALAAAAALASGCSHPEAREARPAQPVRTELVAEAPAQAGVRYSASIEAYERIPLAFKASGYVDGVLRRSGADGRLRTAQPGDRVTKGTVLANVREIEYRERVAQGRARVAEGEASLMKARLDLDRARTLFAAESLTKPELDGAQSAFDAAEARVASARADVELAVSALRDCLLVAPASGIILERRIEAGSLASAGTLAFVLGDVSSVKARFGIPDAMIHAVRPGDGIAVIVEAVSGTTFSGRITAVAPAADPQSRVFDVEVTIPNQDGLLRPGMIGTVNLSQSAAHAAGATTRLPAVPLTAIVRSAAADGQFAVVVVEREQSQDVARLRRVELGEVTGNAIAVLKGIKTGERVVTSGATLLSDGEPVRVLE